MVLAREKLQVNEGARREELKHFLRSRRERLSPLDFGFPDGSRRRTPGLRRDEVAQLAGIGTTTYTFLEQGRDMNVSEYVLDKLAEVLRLNEQEKRHLYRLAKGELPQVTPLADEPYPSLQTVLNSLGSTPGLVFNHRFDIVAWNRSAELVFGLSESRAPMGRNILWRLFADPSRMEFYEDWNKCSRCVVAYCRGSYARHIGDEEVSQFIRHLEARSEEFRRLWSEYEVFDPANLLDPILLNHPRLGRLTGHYVLMSVFGYPNLTMDVFAPDPTTDTAEKIEEYLAKMPLLVPETRR
jgi:PAS domain-containing protein